MKIKLSIISILTVVLALTLSESCFAGIAVLDMTARNGEDDINGDWARNVYSANYLCDIAGYQYITTTDLDKAMSQDLILFSSCITTKSFSSEEWEKLKTWVENGGILVSPALRSVKSVSYEVVSDLFGVDVAKSGEMSKEKTIINWNPEFYDHKELEYIDEEHERATSIGQVKSYSLSPKDCDVLAYFDGGGAAVTRRMVGLGKTYLAQVVWRDVVQRNQLNKDQNSSREYNNGFEPSSDVWAFFLRSIYAASHDVSVWKFTVPGGYTQLLVPTHDCDSRTAYDAMHYMADYEKSLNLRGHYFLTVHYFSDKKNFGHSYLSDFYNDETMPLAKKLIADGHTVGSHSICHFPDFNKTGNTDVVSREEYAFRATCEDGVSRSASTWAELVLSKQILEEDLGNEVKSFRSGHLCVNKDMPAMLEEGNYKFQSCFAGGDILSEFPFFGRMSNQWEGDQTNVLTMQLHISDVYNNKEGVEPLNDDTWSTHSAPDDWYKAMQKLRGNYASAVLLIHPNREWKMTLQKKLIDQLDFNEVALYNFEDYGEFWLSRLNSDFSYEFDKDSGVLSIVTDTEAMRKFRLTFAVEVTDGDVSKVVVSNPQGDDMLEAELRSLTEDRYLVIPRIFDYDPGMGIEEIEGYSSAAEGVYDLSGRVVMAGCVDQSFVSNLPKGIYIVKNGNEIKKLKI